MAQITTSRPIFILPTISHSFKHFSKYLNKDACSKSIRQRFLDYFINENNHTFVKSSPVVPYCDPTVAFVNAGMNQFKEIFLGTQTSPHKRAANSQKCIRVGGKHNDLTEVGMDGYHHTFFEMLGNWSFGDYFKLEACTMAWDLLTNVYKIPRSRLYVTYFKGDSSLGIAADLETKEIWKTLGIPESKILPFGLKDNFWEMGLVGPCGPCTEIHYDHIGTANRGKFVNKGLHDLTEIWNIVFIQYNRLNNQQLIPLNTKHVDTGIGFERLTSVLQGKISNYDTDNFKYLLKAIHKNCRDVPKYGGKFGEKDWNDLDKSYRTLADHTRMITVCLADGVIPEKNQKLRRIMRKSFSLCDTVFKKGGLLKELSNYVIENLGPMYPELEKNLNQIHQIISYEEEIYKALRTSAAKDWQNLLKDNSKLADFDIIETPSFITGYRELTSINVNEIDPKLAFKLYDTYGVDEDGIIKLSQVLNLKFDPQDLQNELEEMRLRQKKSLITDNKLYSLIVDQNIPKTNDSFKYLYKKEDNKYIFDKVKVNVLKIFEDDKEINEIPSDHYCALLLDKTNLYTEAGGQIGDKGFLQFSNDTFEITSVENINGFILHKGFFKSTENTLKPCAGILRVAEDFRLNCMRNHTCTHILNAVLKKFKGVTCQKSSKVTNKYLTFDVALFGEKLTNEEVLKIENEFKNIIDKQKSVIVKLVNSRELLSFDDVTLIPGEVYPDNNIRIIEISDNQCISREPCCGTHILNTGDIEDFCIIAVKSLGRSTTSISAVSGDRAKLAKTNGNELIDEICSLNIHLNDNIDKPDMLEMAIATLRKRLKNIDIEDDSILPYYVKTKCVEKLEKMSSKIKNTFRETFRDFIEIEMKNALDSNVKTTKSNKNYIVHYLRSSVMLENVPLQKATRLCPSMPVLVIAYTDNTVKARCCVPPTFKSEQFDAEKWMKESVAKVFRSRAAPPKGQDGSLVCNMKAKKVPVQELDPLLKDSLEKAQQYIEERL